MSDETYSPQALAAFEREWKQKPLLRGTGNWEWLSGYDTARRDNAAAMELMENELADWRTGHRKLRDE